ncbi:hypothetical protein N657DRAFT_649632 [Parathielavia appendiculata]|uniref:Uncharacterized protein n=1 Tax=Parathielavia appendiculata TaxID=2587402 RepID=A0AAN6YZK1_9PEZI|nr:hypothetical protein N657DRAFT_649632 [Parathielavia appendiculata]
MAAAVRDQILTNAKVLFGPTKKFEIVTCLVMVGQYGNIQASQAILVEIDSDSAAYKTHLVGQPAEQLEAAYEELHIEVRRLIYQKFSESLEPDSMIEPGPTTLEGTLDW